MSTPPEREPEPSKLNDEWERQQQKTFTAWINSHLRKRNLEVKDVAKDLSDGRNLLALLEIISDEALPKPSRGTMRIHHVENVGKAMKFIQEKKVDVSSIGPEEVVDSNLKMILGLIWMLILRFEIQDISEDQLNAKDALLLWCQRKTEPYSNVEVQNFHMSWKDGLAFCALIHRHRPDLIDYDKLSKSNPRENLTTAFEVAEKELNIPKFLDVEDMVNCIKPDERSIMTYVAAYYKCFASFNQAEVAAKKIATVLETNREHERLIAEYETMATALLEWIQKTIAWLVERPAINDVQTCQDKLETLNNFRSSELPGKLEERAKLEEHYSTLQTKLRLSGRPPFVASESKEIADITAAWTEMEEADQSHLQWVIDELKRVRQAEAKAALFTSKAEAHEAWTSGKNAMLSADDYTGVNLATVSALMKKHEAFQSDLTAHEQRVHEIGTLANELDDLKYVNADAVNDRYATIYENWQHLVQLTQERQTKLSEAEANARHLDELYLQFARQAPPFSNFVELAKEKLTEPFVVETEEEAAHHCAFL
ncbi:actinin [Salpingoeca rosetta]|uniref:Actinin n=1 Tax=Salpingoeca rosetta (strain ATCC 50818 / BSB-021) TaxID=946362 RepID=F2TYT5_SALR5|nr:actinin [Salpingoeca rosetta]EGD78759.1 actinin [Salpingoeca rosetta]|eukprot:XP_004997716.1 actinin [Salpingoeca rosetta]